MDKNQILDQLKQINYPGFNRDIVSFGMVKDVVIDQSTITIILAISSSNEEKKNQLVQEISDNIKVDSFEIKIKVLDQAPRKTVDTSNKDANVQGNIKNIIAVASGKGGVGKSTIALNLAAALSKAGHKTGLLDLDIYGPSLPITMGIVENPEVNDQQKIIPVLKDNLKLMSFGFISGNQAPVVWRGPLVAKMTEQFFRDVVWGELDYLILDLPPGTGDVQLTLSQKIPLDGAIIVTTPNDIALTDVRKGADMFSKVKTPLLGVVENMSFMQISGKLQSSNADLSDVELYINEKKISLEDDKSFNYKFHLFKEGGGLNESQRLDVPLLGQIPYSEDLMQKNHPRTFGHGTGAQTAKTIINDCVKKEIPHLTLYTFSKENWSRPKEEIDMLMVLLSTMLEKETENMLRNNIRFNIVGKIEDLPDKTRDWVLSTIEKTKNNTGLILTLALSYGGRQEIVDAFNSLIKSDVKIINEEILKNHLYCPELPDPDMIIRTGGEYRLSNFLLWQSAYAEIYVCNKNWPDFDVAELEKALKEYDNRNRTFGKV